MSRTELPSPREVHRRRLRRYLETRDFDAVLGLLAAAEARGPLELNDLIVKGQATQLADEGEGDPVETAESAFLEVLRRDPDHVEALLELGWLERAKALSESAVAEAERGLRASRQEIEETLP